MSTYSVDSEAVASATASSRSAAERVRADVAALLSSLQGLQSSWTGVAAMSFQEVLERWRAMQRQVDAELDQLSLALDNAARHYADAEQSNVSLFRV